VPLTELTLWISAGLSVLAVGIVAVVAVLDEASQRKDGCP
jgi:hypothetical protein